MRSVVAEVKKVEGEVVAKEKAAVIQLKAEEKLALADLELEFLKARLRCSVCQSWPRKSPKHTKQSLRVCSRLTL